MSWHQRRPSPHGLLLLLAMLWGTPGRPVRAEGSVEAQKADAHEPAGYRETVAEAVREFAAHDFEQARLSFARAHALYPNARTYRGLGLTEFELRNYEASIRELEAALRSSVKPLTAELRVDTEQMLVRARQFVALVYLDVKPAADTVVVDGLAVTLAPAAPLVLTEGDHVVEVGAHGFRSEKRHLSAKGGDQTTITVVLSPSAQATPAPSPTARPWHKSPWLWGSVGVLVAGAAAGGVGYAVARPEKGASPYGGTADLLLKGQ